jgi:hypothetical protein
VPRKKAEPIREEDLQRWKLLPAFAQALQEALAERGGADGSWADPRRQLELAHYLSLFLLGLFNPVVKTMRGLCAASQFERVQREVSGRAVSLGSFSEAQALVEPALLEAVFGALASQVRPDAQPLAGLTGRELRVVDSTVWQVLPRMSWAFWRGKGGSRAGPDNAIRWHVHFDLNRKQVKWGEMTPAKVCERAHWREHAEPGAVYIGDRNYSNNYDYLRQMQAAGVEFLVRLFVDAQWVVESEEALTEADRAASVVWAGTVRLGKNGDGPRVRVIEVLGEEETIVLATTLPAELLPPELAATLYRQRWQVEMFFRWLKCILGCRHWLAESPRGVALQVYLALIAAQLLVLFSGQRPNRRQMEAIQFYTLGWASAEEVGAQLVRYGAARKNA